VGESRQDQDTGRNYTLLENLVVNPAKALPPVDVTNTTIPEMIVKRWLLPPVYKRLRQGQGDFLAELRPAIVLFLSFTGIDFDGDPDAGEKLDAVCPLGATDYGKL
jgi:hypothetical protein